MSKDIKQKRPLIDEALHRPIQDYANRYFDGNFTQAVDMLVRSALLADSLANKKTA